MANIEGELWRSEEPNFIYGIRCPYEDLRAFNYVNLMPDQEAVMISSGGLLAHYESETNLIDKNLIPSGPKFAGISFGKTNPAKVELWIINIQRPGSSLWEIDNLEVLLKGYNKVIPLKIKIQYGVDVVNSKDFINYFIGRGGGSKSALRVEDVHEEVFQKDSIRLRETIVKFIENNGLFPSYGVNYLEGIANELINRVYDRLAKRGLKLRYLDVESIEIDVDHLTPMKRQLYIAGLGLDSHVIISSRSTTAPPSYARGYENIPIDFNKNNDSMPTVSTAGLTARNSSASYRSVSPAGVNVVYCAQCSKKHLSSEKYCSNCGNEYRPCPGCGSDNLPAAKRCVRCGYHLIKEPIQSALCPDCGRQILAESSFCPHCGKGQVKEKVEYTTCKRCNSTVASNTKFCTKCGNRM